MDRLFCWQLMEQKIFHVTSQEGFAGIAKDSLIRPSGMDVAASFEQTRFSFASSNKYVSLFDFVHCPSEKIDLMMHIWCRVVAKHDPTILLNIDAERIAGKLIPNETLGRGYADPEFMSRNYYIPGVEAWYPTAIGLDLVLEVHEVDWRQRRIRKIEVSGA
jgi:hypothetical protein